MGEIYTSRFSNKELRSGNYIPLSITVGQPRFPLGYTVAGQIRELAPYELFKRGYGKEEYTERYFAKMDKVGVAALRRIFAKYEALYPGKPIVLLCYEDVRDETQFCHRSVFADWWKARTGEEVKELPDSSPEKKPKAAKKQEPKKEAEKSEKKFEDFDQLSLFF
jgi:hypothetical protein